jgi:tetratricopeptide (TPR) repeat protein
MDAARAAEGGADKGVAAWKDVVAKHPKELAARREYARVLKAAGAWQPLVDAAKDEEAKVATTPHDKAAALRDVAFGYSKLGNENQVITALAAALHLAPDDEAYDQLAAIYENKKRWPDLVKLLGEKRRPRRRQRRARSRSTCRSPTCTSSGSPTRPRRSRRSRRCSSSTPTTTRPAIEHLLAVYEKRRDWEKLIKLKEARSRARPRRARRS